MFRNACVVIRESIYGVLCQSPAGEDKVTFGNGTAFIIAPGICATAAHVLHVDGNVSNPVHQKIEVIRAPDIGKSMLHAKLIAENIDRDLALIEIIDPLNTTSVVLYNANIERGTTCGSLGFPLSSVDVTNNQVSFNLVERFQGAHI